MANENITNGWQGGKWIRPDKRLAIYLRDRFECSYCGTDLANAKRASVTLDPVWSVWS